MTTDNLYAVGVLTAEEAAFVEPLSIGLQMPVDPTEPSRMDLDRLRCR